MVVIFLFFRILFYFTAHHKISVFFRSFSFISYLIIIIFEGNISSFAFLLTNDIIFIVFHDVAYLAVHCLSIFCFFFLVFYIFSFQFIIFSWLNILAKYLFASLYPILKSAHFLTLFVTKYTLVGIMSSITA